ncbi:hypothetical protein L3Q82_002410 [Scortum barcoo]|uniref:Uncharacterized protein n=1 Tax=Scortum barcoo TaxID=214431 RepID=A0ACB8VYH2_9TELE|nr:hypothetical protein L3Q82_002410 [Scortum barcoo]
MRQCLASGGFEIQQWANNFSSVVSHLPSSARSESTKLWLAEKNNDPQEPALGLQRHCQLIGSVTSQSLQLWAKKRSWDDPNLPPDILQAWSSWERELPELTNISIPQTYAPLELAADTTEYTLHVFCDSSEQAYGSVAYLTTTSDDTVHVSFVMARSRVARKCQQSMPRLELCAVLTGAQLTSLIHKELTLCIAHTFLWTDFMTVLTWLTSQSYKLTTQDTRCHPVLQLERAGQSCSAVASPLCDLRDAEVHLLKASQANCFSEEVRCLRAGKPVSPSSAQGEPALVCEKYRAPVADLQILVFFSKCQSSSTVLGSEHRAHYRTSGPSGHLHEVCS